MGRFPMIRQVFELLNAPEGSEHKGYFIVSDLAYRKTRAGHDYATLLLKDASGALPARIWRERLPLLDKYDIQNGTRVMVELKIQRYRGRSSAEVRFIRTLENGDGEKGFQESLLQQWTDKDIEDMYAELLSLLETVERPPVKNLVLKVLEKYGKLLKVMPGARSIHHAYRGGLLEHTLTTARICLYLGGVYNGAYPQGIDRDILLAGAILHDIGKIEEIDQDRQVHTVYGSLIGHILISRDMVREAAQEVENLNPTDLLMLEHLIVSHQGRKEWGAPQEPKTAEALILHYADDCDAKVNIFFNALERDTSRGELTPPHHVLGRQLYKKGGAPLPSPAESVQQKELDLAPPGQKDKESEQEEGD
jgi:3'-5' exoribonuclease